MTRLAVILAVLGTAAAQSKEPQEKPKYPPFIVVITAKTGKLVPGDLQPLLNSIKQMKGHAEQTGRVKVPGEWMEAWTFQIPGEKKFDPSPFYAAFAGRFNASKYYLTMTGTLSQEAQTRRLFITSYSGKSKVKLMNRPKDVFDKEERKDEDIVGKLVEIMSEGKLHFTVDGDIFNHGGALAILLDTFKEAEPPPEKPPENKK
jgi:hypothetical protein